MGQGMLRFEELGTRGAVELTEGGEVFEGEGREVLFQTAGVVDVG